MEINSKMSWKVLEINSNVLESPGNDSRHLSGILHFLYGMLMCVLHRRSYKAPHQWTLRVRGHVIDWFQN